VTATTLNHARRAAIEFIACTALADISIKGEVMRIPLSPTQAPALAIAVFVRKRGAAYSAEILDSFDISESTLRRRRPELHRLGIEFVRRGRGSFYADSSLTRQFPTNYLP
jgi:hypothetical protein